MTRSGPPAPPRDANAARQLVAPLLLPPGPVSPQAMASWLVPIRDCARRRHGPVCNCPGVPSAPIASCSRWPARAADTRDARSREGNGSSKFTTRTVVRQLYTTEHPETRHGDTTIPYRRPPSPSDLGVVGGLQRARVISSKLSSLPPSHSISPLRKNSPSAGW